MGNIDMIESFELIVGVCDLDLCLFVLGVLLVAAIGGYIAEVRKNNVV